MRGLYLVGGRAQICLCKVSVSGDNCIQPIHDATADLLLKSSVASADKGDVADVIEPPATLEGPVFGIGLDYVLDLGAGEWVAVLVDDFAIEGEGGVALAFEGVGWAGAVVGDEESDSEGRGEADCGEREG